MPELVRGSSELLMLESLVTALEGTLFRAPKPEALLLAGALWISSNEFQAEHDGHRPMLLAVVYPQELHLNCTNTFATPTPDSKVYSTG
jgi:hypothetical protein